MKANLFSAKKLPRRVLIGALLAFSSIAAACGSDSSTSTDSVAVDSTQVVSEAPQKIISLSATHTEILFAVGAGDQRQCRRAVPTSQRRQVTTGLKHTQVWEQVWEQMWEGA